MVDPYTIGAGAIVAYISKDGISKLLGPTADYLGAGLRDFTEERMDRIGRIFASASKKLRDNIENDGRVPPKVLRDVINEGSFSESDIAVEYFGGVLASSRTSLGRDDRGARMSRLVSSLSAYQLRGHYIIYNSVAVLFSSHGLSMSSDGRNKMRVFFPMDKFLTAMEFTRE